MSHKPQIFIDISDAEWRIVQFRSENGKIVFKRCDVVGISGRGPEEIERDLKSVLVSVRRSDVVLSLPRRKVLLKHMRLPSSDAKEITKMVGLQLVSQIPYAVQDVVYDHVILRTDEAGYAYVQVIVVLASVIDEYLRFLKPLSFSISRMVVSSYGIAAWFALMAQKRAWPSEEVFLVLNLDQEHSEACFCQGSRLLFSRFIPSGKNDLARKETAVFFQQLQWSVDLYQKEHAGLVWNRVLIVGALEDSQFLKTAMEDKLNVTVDTVHPLDVMEDKDHKMFEGMKAGTGRSWTVCLGQMLNSSTQTLNVSPGTLRRDYASQRQSQRRVITIVLAVLVAALGIGLAVMEISFRQMRLRGIEQQIHEIQPQADRLKGMTEHTRALDDYFRKRVEVSELMKELYQLTPEDVVYQSIYWTQEGEWIVQGYAQTRSGVNNLQSGLIDSTWFQDVQLDYATQRRLGNVDVTDFRIHCRVAEKTRGVR